MKTKPCLVMILAALAAPFLSTLCTPGAAREAAQHKYFVYIGTYTEKGSKGIYACRFDPVTDHLDSMGLAAETADPSFLAIDPGHRYLYAVNEVSEYQGHSSGAVSAFAIAPGTGKLTFLNEVASGGAGPCHLTVDNTGKYVLVANYGGGSLAVFPILSDGRLGKPTAFMQHKGASVNPQRQEGPHVHSVYMSPDNRYVISADLGLDEVFVYRFDAAKGTLAPNIPPSATVASGAGPRHFVFSPNGKFGYVIDELQSTVTPFGYEPAKGALDVLQPVSTLPDDFKGDSTAAEVAMHPSGKFLYASNRGLDTIAVFSANSKRGTLTLQAEVPTLGKTPRSFTIDPSGTYLFVANQDSDNVVQFRINPTTGLLSPTGQVLQAPSPVCITFLPVE